MDEVKLDAATVAKLNGKRLRLLDERGNEVGFYLPPASYWAMVGPRPQPPFTEEELAAAFAPPGPDDPGRPLEDILADLRKL